MIDMKNNNPLGLVLGRKYWLRYLHGNSTWQKVEITRFTTDGYPWGHEIGGVVTDSYEMREITIETEIVDKARIFLQENGLKWMSDNSNFAELMAEFHNNIEPRK